jgi:hypothetical protein
MIKIKIDFSNGPVRLLHAPDDTSEVADGWTATPSSASASPSITRALRGLAAQR